MNRQVNPQLGVFVFKTLCMKAVKQNIEGIDMLVITIPLQSPAPSSSGKTLLVASGSKKTDCIINGKPVTVTLNAYIKPD